MSSFVTPSTNTLAKSCGRVSQAGAAEKQEPEMRKEQISHAFPSKHLHNDTDMDLFCLLFICSFIRLSGEINYTSIRTGYLQIHLLYYPVKYEPFSYMSNLKIFMFMRRCKITKFMKSTIL